MWLPETVTPPSAAERTNILLTPLFVSPEIILALWWDKKYATLLHRLQSEVGNTREEGATGTRDGVEERWQDRVEKNNQKLTQVATQIQDENSEAGQRKTAQKAELGTISVFSSSHPFRDKSFMDLACFEFTIEYLYERKIESLTPI